MNLESGGFIVMPYHIHEIMIIGRNRYNSEIDNNVVIAKAEIHCSSTRNKFGPQSKNLASIIKGYKTAVTIYA